jgi:hypothetical protein
MAEYDRLAGVKGQLTRWLRYEPRSEGDVLELDMDQVEDLVEQLQYAVDTILNQRQRLHEYRQEVRRLNVLVHRT